MLSLLIVMLMSSTLITGRPLTQWFTTSFYYKLWAYGIDGDLRAYLTNRIQCVSICGQSSTFLPVVSGVPQGSLLGPLFYIINNMFDTIKVARPFTYADDTKLLIALHDSFDNVSLQEDLNQVFLWSHQWDLLLNPAKCCHIHYNFSKSTSDQHYLIHDNPVSTNHDIYSSSVQ